MYRKYEKENKNLNFTIECNSECSHCENCVWTVYK